MESRATGQFIRIAPRKIRLLAGLMRGKSVPEAQVQLEVSPKAARTMLLKLLSSAVTNAENLKMDKSKLYIKTITVDGGPMLKRFRPRAFGRAGTIRKRTSHINIVLGEKN